MKICRLQCLHRSVICSVWFFCGLQARLKQDGDVMPTLDMALFDWTDYEDLKPEMWPAAKKKGAKPLFQKSSCKARLQLVFIDMLKDMRS